MKTIAILGAGTAGTALSQVAAENGHSVHLWGIETAVLEEIQGRRANSKYLPDIGLHERIKPCWTLVEALAGVEIVIVTVPTHAVRAVAGAAAPYLVGGPVVLNVAKGLEEGTDLRMSQVLAQELGTSAAAARIASMGGPALATEFVRGVPTAVIVASEPLAAAMAVQGVLQNEHFKVEATLDMVGVELGATLKNPYAIALGMCDGLGYGANTKSFIATLTLGEMEALITALGGQLRTVYGLAGLGDLLTTGYSPLSRNHTLGERLGSGGDWREFLQTHTVEGVAACRAGRDLARCHGIATPLLDTVHDVLFGGKPAAQMMRLFLKKFWYGS